MSMDALDALADKVHEQLRNYATQWYALHIATLYSTSIPAYKYVAILNLVSTGVRATATCVGMVVE